MVRRHDGNAFTHKPFGHRGVSAAVLGKPVRDDHDPRRRIRGLPCAHVDAQTARTDKAEVAGELVRRLREVTDDFLKRENEFRPDYLESIFATPLAPGAAES